MKLAESNFSNERNEKLKLFRFPSDLTCTRLYLLTTGSTFPFDDDNSKVENSRRNCFLSHRPTFLSLSHVSTFLYNAKSFSQVFNKLSFRNAFSIPDIRSNFLRFSWMRKDFLLIHNFYRWKNYLAVVYNLHNFNFFLLLLPTCRRCFLWLTYPPLGELKKYKKSCVKIFVSFLICLLLAVGNVQSNSLSLARQSEVEILCEKWQENCKIYVNFRCTTGNFQLSTNFAGFSLHLMRVLLLWDEIENREIGEHFFVSCLHYAKQFPLEDTHRGCDRGKRTHRK